MTPKTVLAAIVMVFLASECPATTETIYITPLPEVLSRTAPNYPEDARKSQIEGTVIVQALVGKNGRVQRMKVIKSVPGLDAAALRAVKRWRFKVPTLDGKRTATWVAIPIKFTL